MLHNIRHGSWSTAPVIKAGVPKSVGYLDGHRQEHVHQSYMHQNQVDVCAFALMISFSGILVSNIPAAEELRYAKENIAPVATTQNNWQ